MWDYINTAPMNDETWSFWSAVVGSAEQRVVGWSRSGHRLYRYSESFLGWARLQKEASCWFNPTHLSLFPATLTFSWFMCSCASWQETALPEHSSPWFSHQRTPVDLLCRWFMVPLEQEISCQHSFFWSKVNSKGIFR